MQTVNPSRLPVPVPSGRGVTGGKGGGGGWRGYQVMVIIHHHHQTSRMIRSDREMSARHIDHIQPNGTWW